MSEATTTKHVAEVHHFTTSLSAEHRCDRCNAHAFYEAEVAYLKETEDARLVTTKTQLRFCAHHAGEHHEALVVHPQVTRIADYRQALKPKS